MAEDAQSAVYHDEYAYLNNCNHGGRATRHCSICLAMQTAAKVTSERLERAKERVGDGKFPTSGQAPIDVREFVKSLDDAAPITNVCAHGVSRRERCGVCNAEVFSRAVAGLVKTTKEKIDDAVNHPSHYTKHPSGVECIIVTEHMNFNVGNAIKYLWRAGSKNNLIEDLKKARWYVDREILRQSTAQN